MCLCFPDRDRFIGVADGLVPGVAAGVEEVTAIATCQALFGPEHARAKLVRLPEVCRCVGMSAGRVAFYLKRASSE